ncbi:MAG: ATP-dependent DNA helicase RecG [Corynebacterium sp.]|nr:ATP-dependent DNA helicase RecG [Corynebacterium sp.]
MLGWTDHRVLTDLLPASEVRALKRTFGIATVPDLLLHYPRRWVDAAKGAGIMDAEDGDTVTAIGTIASTRTQISKQGKAIFHVLLDDGIAPFECVFFNAAWAARTLQPGLRILVTGKVRSYRSVKSLQHPGYLVLDSGAKGTGQLKELGNYPDPEAVLQRFADLSSTPIYRGSGPFTSVRMWAAIAEVLRQTPPIPEPLGITPPGLVSFDTMLRAMHTPGQVSPYAGLQRAKYNEALSLALIMAQRRADNAHHTGPACPPIESGLRDQFVATLPYTLTPGQSSVIAEIAADLTTPTPMMRLLQGEVGSGKTVVALISMLQAIDAGYQCAFLAPTEVLAVQHARSLVSLLAALPVRVSVLTGSMTTAAKREALLHVVSGEADIVVGTHALIQDTVEFFNLGLVVVDEQHRFGVEQRDELRGKGKLTPHLLAMTATPIPRTIAITAFGDLEVSTIGELPGGRKPIRSAVVPASNPRWVTRMYERIREDVAAGRQAFVVCPRISGDGGAEEVHRYLSEEVFPVLRVSLLHGKLPGADKDAVMSQFARGDCDILVATTVIEVGIDVPNATVMVILESEHFGVSQLHQLRGRIGRGGHESWCLFHTTAEPATPAYERVCAVAATTDGFELATLDLQTRQEGDVVGTAQSGRNKTVKLLSFVCDGEIIERAARDASDLVARDRELAQQLVADMDERLGDYLEKS